MEEKQRREALYEQIGLPVQAIEQLQRVEKTLDTKPVQEQIERLTDVSAAREAYLQLRETLKEDADGWKMLLCQMKAADLCREHYRKQKIGEEIFVDTMRCFSRFIRECHGMSGHFAFDRGWWTWRQLCMSLFRLGDLECELCTRENERVISLHIPSDADLSPAAVDRSLGQIVGFVQRYFPQWAAAPMVCDSWLLSPALQTMLSQDSNIRAFAARFTIEEYRSQDKEFFRWLFAVGANTPLEQLPEQTGLQKAAKTYLQAGGSIGAAYGVMRSGSQKDVLACQG